MRLSASDKLPEGQGFAVEQVNQQDDASLWLALTRKATGSEDLFASMASDVVGALDDAAAAGSNEKKLLRVFLGRVGAWQEFMRKGFQTLSPEAEIGLVGELGSQKNFDRFMASITPAEGQEIPLPSVQDFKAMIAKAKIYRDAQKYLRPMFPAFQANVTAYTVALMSEKLGSRIDLDRIWTKQAVSPAFLAQMGLWAKEVNDVLHKSAGGRMVSEWAKKPECKDEVMSASYSSAATDIPELKAG